MRTFREFGSALSVLFFSLSLHAGTTGKIAGRVIDGETGEPLLGVNVVIKGTLLGTSTDLNGNFFILNVPVGTYSVASSMIGYETKELTEVRIKQDLTTILDFELVSTVVPMEEVRVTAERPIVEIDVTTSVTYLDSKELQAQPVSQFQDAVALSAGAVTEEGVLHIRGGRDREVVYMVDGMVLQDPITGTFDSNIPEASIEELAVYTGGFGAEYGSAQSGVVNVVTKGGGASTSGRISFKSNDLTGITKDRDNLRIFDNNDKVESPGENPYLFPAHHERYKRVDMSLGGPEPITTYLLPEFGAKIPGEEIRYFISSEITNTLGRFPTSRSVTRTWNYPWEDPNDPEVKKKMQGRPDVEKTLSGKLSYSPTTTQRITVGGLKNWNDYGEFSNSWKYHLRGRRQFTEQSSQAYVNWSHTLSQKTFYEIKLDQYKTSQIWDLEGDYYIIVDDYGDTIQIEAKGKEIPWGDVIPGAGQDENVPYPDSEVNGWYTSGNYRLNYHEDERTTVTLRGDLTSQVNPKHLMKTGFEMKYFDLSNFLADVASGDNLYWDDYRVFPAQMGLYAQDKMEFQGMIVNAGLRADYLDPKAMVPADPYKPVPESLLADGGVIQDPVPSTKKFQLSPRLGISHPLTPNDVFNFTYGHYFQIPQLSYLYENMNYVLTGAFGIIGYANLLPEKTVSYEVGIEHAFTSYFKIDATGFNKDITGLTDIRQVLYSPVDWFGLRTNTDYGNIRGFELSLKKLTGGALRFWSGSLNYTYAIAKGKSSSNRQNYDLVWENYQIPTTEHPLDWDQRHTVAFNLGVDIPPGEKVLGLGFLNNLGLNLVTSFGSGFPWTPPSRTDEEKIRRINELRMPYTTTTDLKMRKGFRFYDTELFFFADVLNLFDKPNNLLRIVDEERYYLEYWIPHEIEGKPADFVKAAGGEHRDPGVVGPRRRIRTGITFEF